MPLLPYLNWMELRTEGVAKFIWRNGIIAIHQEMIKGRKLKKGERITDAKAQQRLIDFIKDSYERGYFNHDIQRPENILIDPKGMPHIVDFGTVKELGDDDDREWLQGWALKDLKSRLF